MDNFTKKLRLPFPEKDIEWRVARSGKTGSGKIWAMVLAYVTNRAIQERLDDTFGIANWKNEYKTAPDGGVLCGISVKIDGEWITKWDGAENTQIEAIKGGLSGAMKRAAVQWGIGRYLYNLTEGFATITEKKGKDIRTDKLKDGTYFNWQPPKLPSWALPPGEKKYTLDDLTAALTARPAVSKEDILKMCEKYFKKANPKQLVSEELKELIEKINALE